MSKDDVLKGCACAVAVAVTILIFVGIWVGRSYFEARAYNHATDARVTTWDAMWLELRVQEGAKKDG